MTLRKLRRRLRKNWMGSSSKNRHLAIYLHHPIHDIIFISKDLSPLTLTGVDIFRSAGSVIDCHHPPNFPSHPIFTLLKTTPLKMAWKRKEKKVVKDHNDVLNPFSSPVFSSFLPHHFYSILIHFFVWYGGRKREWGSEVWMRRVWMRSSVWI